MDSLAALRLQIEWGADEALGEAPVDRMAARATAARPSPAPPAPGDAVSRPRPKPNLVPEAPRPDRVPEAARPNRVPEAPRPNRVPEAPVARAQALATAARTLEELRQALAGFDGCPLAATATNLVFNDGNPHAGLMLVGEGPGAEEDRAGRPFVGPSGQFLDRMLGSIGLDRTKYLITNLIPWRPPGNRNPTDSEIVVCLPFLLRQIALVRPRRLVLLGALAAQALSGSNTGIRKLRGKWLQLAIPGLDAPVPTLPMLHPAYLLRTPGAKRDAWADMLALRRSLDDDSGADKTEVPGG